MVESMTDNRNTMNNRQPLWKIDKQYYLPLLAVCFSASEISLLIRNTSSLKKSPICFIELLETLITKMVTNPSLAHMVQEKLNHKYRLIIKQFDELSCETDIVKLWDFYWHNGEFRGAFWAIIRNAHVGKKLKEQILRQVEITSLQNCCTILKGRKHEGTSVNFKDLAISQNDERERQYLKEKCQYCKQIKELETELFLKEYQVEKLKRHLDLYSNCHAMHR